MCGLKTIAICHVPINFRGVVDSQIRQIPTLTHHFLVVLSIPKAFEIDLDGSSPHPPGLYHTTTRTMYVYGRRTADVAVTGDQQLPGPILGVSWGTASAL